MKARKPGWPAVGAAAALAAMALQDARAQSPPAAPKLDQPTQSLALQNRSAQPITDAQATMKGTGRQESFTANGAIQPNLGQTLYVPPGSCVTGVTVTFQNGRQLRLDNVDDCRKPLIVVTNDRIELTSGASTNPPNTTLHYNQVLPR